jgi:hypothetical protein
MIRELAQPLYATDKIHCSSIREKKVSRCFGFSGNTYNKSAQEVRSLARVRFRSKPFKNNGG